MTESLKKAFEAAARLSAAEQESLAAAIEDEIESDPKWSESFANSKDVLSKLAQEARREHLEGRTSPLDPEGQ